jgi:transcriptional regulator
VLAVFQGPQHYISPSWYATKQEHGKVVPTWNYAVVHVRGTLQVRDDAAWIFQQMKQLTAQQESPLPHPWHVEDAPAEYTERMVSAVVGIEIPIDSMSGKWKVSQNQPPVNQATVVQALQQIATTKANTDAAAMAALVSGKM